MQSSPHRSVCFVAVALALCLGTSILPALAAGSNTQRSLQFGHRAGFGITVTGRGWKPGSRVAFSVHVGSQVQGVVVRTTKNGAFAIGINNLSMCARPMFYARDMAGHQATLQGPPLGCPQPVIVPTPALTIVRGARTQPRTVHIYGVEPRSVVLRMGDALTIWEGGTSRPSYTPHADDLYLSLVQAGTTPPRTCPQPDCDAGFYWTYIAARAGKTAIDMEPGCREAIPPCELADLGIGVTIQR